MTIKLVYSHHNVVLTLISIVCPSLSGDGHASAMLLIIIILYLLFSVVILRVAMKDAFAQSDHAIVSMYIFLCKRIFIMLWQRLSGSFL